LKQQVIDERERADRAVRKAEEELRAEMTRREERRKNVMVHGLHESTAREGKLRLEADKEQLDEIFTVLDVNISAEHNVEFCRRVGERSENPRPLIVGFYTEWAKDTVLKNTKKLMRSVFDKVSVVPDLTEHQRRAEKEMTSEAERRNREELNEDDLSKNLHWRVVGKKGQRRLLKTVNNWSGEGTSQNRGEEPPRASLRGVARGGAARGGAGLLPPRGGRATWTVRYRGTGRAAATAARTAPEPDKGARKRVRQGSNKEQHQQPRKRGARAV
jgi:hypothetical protein